MDETFIVQVLTDRQTGKEFETGHINCSFIVQVCLCVKNRSELVCYEFFAEIS
jgi:hypothetical protein